MDYIDTPVDDYLEQLTDQERERFVAQLTLNDEYLASLIKGQRDENPKADDWEGLDEELDNMTRRYYLQR